MALAGPLVSLFTNDPAMAAPAVSYLRIVALVFPISAIETAYEVSELTPIEYTAWLFVPNSQFNNINTKNYHPFSRCGTRAPSPAPATQCPRSSAAC